MIGKEGGMNILRATTADVALARARHGAGDITAGEALAEWAALPEETRARILARCQDTATLMFDWEELLDQAVRDMLLAEQETEQERSRTSSIPGLIYGGGRRLAIRQNRGYGKKYQPYCPRNENQYAEGSWRDWTELAQSIIEKEERAGARAAQE